MSAAFTPGAKPLRASRICRDWASVQKFVPSQREAWEDAADTIESLYRAADRLIEEFVDPQQGLGQFSSATTRKAVELAQAALAKARGES